MVPKASKQAASSNTPLVFLFITSVNGANGFYQIFIHSENQDNLNVLWSVASQASYSSPRCDFLKSSCSWTFSRTLTFTEFFVFFFLGKGGVRIKLTRVWSTKRGSQISPVKATVCSVECTSKTIIRNICQCCVLILFHVKKYPRVIATNRI